MLLADDWGSAVFFSLFVVVAIVLGCALAIAFFWHLNSKPQGSKELFWGSLLGVASVHIVELFFGYWSFHAVYTSLLPAAALAAALSYLLNLWPRKKHPFDSHAQSRVD